jgi:hypothetical protein
VGWPRFPLPALTCELSPPLPTATTHPGGRPASHPHAKVQYCRPTPKLVRAGRPCPGRWRRGGPGTPAPRPPAARVGAGRRRTHCAYTRISSPPPGPDLTRVPAFSGEEWVAGVPGQHPRRVACVACTAFLGVAAAAGVAAPLPCGRADSPGGRQQPRRRVPKSVGTARVGPRDHHAATTGALSVGTAITDGWRALACQSLNARAGACQFASGRARSAPGRRRRRRCGVTTASRTGGGRLFQACARLRTMSRNGWPSRRGGRVCRRGVGGGWGGGGGRRGRQRERAGRPPRCPTRKKPRPLEWLGWPSPPVTPTALGKGRAFPA